MERNEDDRPVHVEIDVSTGAVSHTLVTDQEWDEIDARGRQLAENERARQQQDQELAKAVADHPDPVVQALAARAGLV